MVWLLLKIIMGGWGNGGMERGVKNLKILRILLVHLKSTICKISETYI
jgi:hypothetical protein